MKSQHYLISIGSGAGVHFVDTPDSSRVSHEVMNLPDGWTINIWLMEDDTPVRKCDPAEFCVITVTQAEPIIGKWISEAVAEIEAKTDVKMDSNDVLEDLADCDWIFGITVNDEETKINMALARAQLDRITERNIKLIIDEMEAENNV